MGEPMPRPWCVDGEGNVTTPTGGMIAKFYNLADAELAVTAVNAAAAPAPTPMRLRCPTCGDLHIDEGEFATKRHATHACQGCGEVWRPAVVATVGVRFLPGFKNEEPPT